MEVNSEERPVSFGRSPKASGKVGKCPCGPPEPLRIPADPTQGTRSPVHAQCQPVPVSVGPKSHQEASPSSTRASRSCLPAKIARIHQRSPPGPLKQHQPPNFPVPTSHQTPNASCTRVGWPTIPSGGSLGQHTGIKWLLTGTTGVGISEKSSKSTGPRRTTNLSGPNLSPVTQSTVPWGQMAHQPLWSIPVAAHRSPVAADKAVVRDQPLKISPSPRNSNKPRKFPTPTSHQTPHPSHDKARPPIIPSGEPLGRHTAEPYLPSGCRAVPTRQNPSKSSEPGPNPFYHDPNRPPDTPIHCPTRPDGPSAPSEGTQATVGSHSSRTDPPVARLLPPQPRNRPELHQTPALQSQCG